MKKTIENYIIISLGFLVILFIILWDLLGMINWLLVKHNRLVGMINSTYGIQFPELDVHIFGKGYMDISLLLDVIIYSTISLVVIMIILKIYWSERNDSK